MPHIDFGYVNYNYLVESENWSSDKAHDIVPLVFPQYIDSGKWETLFHSMPQEYLELTICLFMGMKPLEIVQALEYPNIARFYNVNARMKSFFRKQKKEDFDL